MKKLLFIMALSLLLFSCSKNTDCYKFNFLIRTTISPVGASTAYPHSQSYAMDNCGMTEDEANTYISRFEKTEYKHLNGDTVIKYVYTCTKKKY